MSLKQTLFPEQKRVILGKRYLSILLRCLHLIGISGMAGHFLFDLPWQAWIGYAILAIGSGLLMVVMEIYGDGVWLVQLRGQIILLKVMLLIAALCWPFYAGYCFMAVIVLSGFFAHAPGKFRYYSIWHRRVVKALRDEKGEIKNCGQY